MAISGNFAKGEVFKGQSLVVGSSAVPIESALSRLAPFIWSHHPAHWEFIDGECLPSLSMHRLIPGVNGMGKDAFAAASQASVESAITSSGKTVIKYADPKVPPYMQSWPTTWTRGNGQPMLCYTPIWQSPRMVAGRFEWTYDKEVHVAWLRELLEKRLIDPMDPVITDREIKRLSDRTARSRQDLARLPGSPVLQSRVEGNSSRLDALMALKEKGKEKGKAKASKGGE